MRYSVGTKLRVQVSRVDLDGRKIDFRLVREGENGRMLPPSRVGKGREAENGNNGGAVDELEAVQANDRAARKAARVERVKGRAAKGRGAVKTAPRKRARR